MAIRFASILGASSLFLAACRVAPPLTVGGEVVWSEARTFAAPDHEEDLKVVAGDIVRFEAPRPIRVAEVSEDDEGVAVVWQTLVPDAGVAFLRAGLFTTAVRAAPETFRKVRTGVARKPEFAWFELESKAVDWASTPLGTPFPTLAAAPRLDLAAFKDLDVALGESLPEVAAGTPGEDVLGALRTLAALRAVHTLEGLRGFPYALNRDLDLSAQGAPRVMDTRTYVAAEPAHAVQVRVEGPSELFVWVRVPRAKADAEVFVRVTETGRLRGSTRGIVRRDEVRGAALDHELSQLRHVIVHVPPGEHAYAIEPEGTAVYVSAEVSHPAGRLEHVFSSRWREERLVATARRSCRGPSPGPACALTLAFVGEESRPEFLPALAKASAAMARVVAAVSAGGPSDRAATLESRAMSGDLEANSEVAKESVDTLDSSFHDAWKRTTLRSTFWEPASSDAGGSKWLTFAETKKAGAACDGDRGFGTRNEVSESRVSFKTTPWRRARALELVAIVPCDGDPIRLEVDGQVVTAQPSGPRALWRIIVKGDAASVRRIDHGAGHVYALGKDGCSTGLETTTAPDPLDGPRALSFPPGTVDAGLEVWVLFGQPRQRVTVHSRDGAETLVIEASPKAGLTGIDERGQNWTRAARVPLPPWATDGITVEGAATSAVRGLVRETREAPAAPVDADAASASPPDERALVDLSRQVFAAKDPRAESELLRRRALLLASYGAEQAALDDAEAARALGGPDGSGAKDEDLVATVRRALRPIVPKNLDPSVPAYGIESDFDPGALRCKPALPGPRADLAVVELALRARPESAPFDRDLAVRAVRAIADAPGDPRSASIERLALRGSAWHLDSEALGGGGRVARPIVSVRDRVFDPEGRLRPSLALGQPLGDDPVAVRAGKPARALLTRGDAKVRLDVVCIAGKPGRPEGQCPLTYSVAGGAPRVVSVPEHEVVAIDVPTSGAPGRRELAISLPPTERASTVLVRIVFDREVPGTLNVKDVGWVLETPRVQHRTLVTPLHPARLDLKEAGVIRVDARAEPGSNALVVALLEGRQFPVRADGEPLVLAVRAPATLTVAARSGEATVAVAEREPSDAPRVPPKPDRSPPASRPAVATLDFSQGHWKDVARASPRPLSALEDRLGSFELDTGVSASSLREGATSATGVDAYAFGDISYRRRIEAPNLYTILGLSGRLRDGPATVAGEAGFYEDLDRYRLRLTGTATGFTQSVEDASVYTLQAQGFLEYSGRIHPDFFILPRLGYDGFYSNLSKPPPSTVNIDDDVYDPFRYVRRTLLFLQGLFWYCPHFNDIYYLRVRADYDATNNAFSHASVLPGVLLIFHQAEMSFYADAEYFAATPGVRPSAGVDGSVGGEFIWHAVVLPGSFELRPVVSSELRVNDASWQVSAGLNFVASYRRGMRDYSSLELSFPEETAGAIPWRDETRVGP